MTEANKQETTEQGLVDALLAGDISTDEFLSMSEQLPKSESEIEEAADRCPVCGAIGVTPDMAGRCPECGARLPAEGAAAAIPPRRGTRARPRRPGAGGAGPGRGLMGVPAGITPGLAGRESLESFDSLVSEACKPGHRKKTRKPKAAKKTKESKQEESLQEFGAPEWREVSMWARGKQVKRTSETQPYYFQEDKMFSRKKQIAVRDLEEKKAKVLSPKVLDAHSGRHSVLAQHGLRSCGYAIEVVDKL